MIMRDSESVQLHVTVTFVLFHPDPFAAGRRETRLIVGAVRSILKGAL